MRPFRFSNLDVTEKETKKRKSIAQFNIISTSPDYQDFMEEYTKVMVKFENYIETKEKLSETMEKYNKLLLTFKTYVDDGSKTILRSMLEVTIKKFEDKLYYEVIELYTWYFGKHYDSLTSGDLLDAFSFEDIRQIKLDEKYNGYLDTLEFLLSIRDLPRGQKLHEIRLHYSVRVELPGDIAQLPPIDAVGKDVVRSSIGKIFSKLSDDIHQASYRFDNESGNFILPRAIGNISIADVYAFATIVIEAGLTPVYPNAATEKSISQQIFETIEKSEA